MVNEQLRLAPELLEVMRAGVAHANARAASFVAPPHLVLALLDDARIGRALSGLVVLEKVEAASAAAPSKLPEVTELPEGALPDGASAPFPRYDTLAFASTDRTRTLYLDRDAYAVFVEGAHRSVGDYRPEHLVMGFAAVANKDGEIRAMLGADPQRLTEALKAL